MRTITHILIILVLGTLVACSPSPSAQANNSTPNLQNTSNDNSVENDTASDISASQDTEVNTTDSNQQPGATEVPPTEEIDVEPTIQPTPTIPPENWQDYPVIPTVSERAIEIYRNGIAKGNDPHTFSKIGDCQNITTYFLAPLENPELHSLGDEYSYLQETIDYFYGSYSRESLAVASGLNVARVLSPLHADPEFCEPNEHSLACEIRINNPSIALVSLEENWGERSTEDYEKYLRIILDDLIDNGILPILATKADNLELDHGINKSIVKLAAEYQLPVWNFWRAVQPLPHHGLQGDGFHLTLAGPYFDNEDNMKSAWAWRNLTALQTLDAVRKAVTAEQP